MRRTATANRRGAEARRPVSDRLLLFPIHECWESLRTCRQHASASPASLRFRSSPFVALGGGAATCAEPQRQIAEAQGAQRLVPDKPLMFPSKPTGESLCTCRQRASASPASSASLRLGCSPFVALGGGAVTCAEPQRQIAEAQRRGGPRPTGCCCSQAKEMGIGSSSADSTPLRLLRLCDSAVRRSSHSAVEPRRAQNRNGKSQRRRGAEARRPASDRLLLFPSKRNGDWLLICRQHASASPASPASLRLSCSLFAVRCALCAVRRVSRRRRTGRRCLRLQSQTPVRAQKLLQHLCRRIGEERAIGRRVAHAGEIRLDLHAAD